MSNQIAPPPTWAPVTEKNGTFSPVWLSWFLSVTATINQTGSSGINHDSLLGLQGGTSGQYYHLDSPTYTSITTSTSMARQLSSAVAITGGSIDGTVIGGVAPAAATVTNLSATGAVKFGTYTSGVTVQGGYITITDAGGTTRKILCA